MTEIIPPKFKDPAERFATHQDLQDGTLVRRPVGGERLFTSDGRSIPTKSWLGRFAEQGWSVMIQPGLTPEQWMAYSQRADETYNELMGNFDPARAYTLLADLFPNHALLTVYCQCRGAHPHPQGGQE